MSGLTARPNSPTAVGLARGHGTSLHRQLFLQVRELISQGAYAPGTVIPAEDELCGIYGVSKITVRRAIADLRAEGWLESRQGRGTFVSVDLPARSQPNSLGLVESLSMAATETRARVLEIGEAVPPSSIAAQLRLSPNETAFHVTRLRSKSGTPVMLTQSWIPAGLAQGISAKQLEIKALYEILMARGVSFGRVVQEITAVIASPVHAGLLQTVVGMPLLRLSRLLYDADRHPVQHLTVHASPERSRVVMDISVDAINSLTAGTLFHDVRE